MSMFNHREPAWRRNEQHRAKVQREAQAQDRRVRAGLPREEKRYSDGGFAMGMDMATGQGSTGVVFSPGQFYDSNGLRYVWNGSNSITLNYPMSQGQTISVLQSADGSTWQAIPNQFVAQGVVTQWQEAAPMAVVAAEPPEPRPSLRDVWRD